MNSTLNDRLHSALQSRQQRSIRRSLEPQPHSNSHQPELIPLDFSSNDYLSFSTSPALHQSLKTRLHLTEVSPFGPSSSRLLDGNTPQHLQLESHLASFFKGSSGLLFNSGFDANIGIWSTLPGPEDYVLYDRLIHASVHDGLRASRCKPTQRISFKHNSVPHLQSVLSRLFETDESVKSGKNNVFIGVESLYSMDGDLCPLDEMVEVIDRIFGPDQTNVHLIVDEAHSTGLYGPSGRGLTVALSLSNRILVRLHTFGKALACSGAIVITTPLIRDYLINYARPLIFSTAMTRMTVLAISTATSELETETHRKAVSQLETLADHLSNLLSELLLRLDISPVGPDEPRASKDVITIPEAILLRPKKFFSPIIPILSHRPRELATYLLNHGIRVRPIGTPTVPSGREMVRVCLHSEQSVEQVELLVKLIERWALDQKKDEVPRARL